MVDILHKIGMQSPLDEVYQAVATREGLASWWTTRTQGESAVGNILNFRFVTGDQDIGGFEMKVLELVPEKRVLWQVADGPQDWIGSQISFDLKRDGDYSILLFKHAGWKEANEHMHHCSTKWAVFLMSLKAFVETGKGRPEPGRCQD